ncbi:MAG: hypothetical protein KJ000_00545 [Pirellulaceae bacterium]|nr:hypothetical protein [Pirellulaceae bacterium]
MRQIKRDRNIAPLLGIRWIPIEYPRPELPLDKAGFAPGDGRWRMAADTARNGRMPGVGWPESNLIVQKLAIAVILFAYRSAAVWVPTNKATTPLAVDRRPGTRTGERSFF